MKLFLIFITILLSVNCFAADPIKLIYDNDAGSDDIIALIYLAHQSNISIEGITIAATGEANRLKGAENMADLCYFLKKPAIPIAYGNEKPHDPFVHPFPPLIRKWANNIFLGKNVPHHPHPPLSSSAILLMKKIVSENDKVSILATGPLTNVAEFIKKYPHLKNKIEKIVIMGGAIHVKGNIHITDPTIDNSVAEWNMYADPKAAQMVFSSGIPITLVPLDATNQVPMTKAFYDTLSQQSQPDLKLIYLIVKDIANDVGEDTFLNHFYLWDPLAAIILNDPTQAVTKSLSISIDINTAQTKYVNNTHLPLERINVVTHIPDAKLILMRFINEIKKKDH